MELINGILKSLSIDQTIFFQFGIFVVLFFVLKVVFFNRLQEVIELRESKTTKLEDEANHKFANAEKLAAQYNERIGQANVEAQSLFNQARTAVVRKEEQRLRSEEEKINAEIDKKRGQFIEEMKSHRELVMKNADSLADNLVEKITN